MSASKNFINTFVDLVDWPSLASYWEVNKDLNLFELKEFQSYWGQNFELRPGQALINLGLMKDSNIRWNTAVKDILYNHRK